MYTVKYKYHITLKKNKNKRIETHKKIKGLLKQSLLNILA